MVIFYTGSIGAKCTYITLFCILALLSLIVLVSFYFQSLDRFNPALQTKKEKGRIRSLLGGFLPYIVNIIYLICFAALAFSLVQNSYLPNYSKISLWYDEAFLGTLVGIIFFLVSMIIAFVTKLEWLRFACLYISGQIFIPVGIMYVVIISIILPN